MKAICKKRSIEFAGNGVILFEDGEIVDYTVSERKFTARGVEMPAAKFFNNFKVIEGFDKMNYSDFEYILCNYVFDMAVLFPNEYNGIHHLIIQDVFKGIIMITVNAEENVVRVSFDDKQENYASYEDAIDGIKNHKKEN